MASVQATETVVKVLLSKSGEGAEVVKEEEEEAVLGGTLDIYQGSLAGC